MSTLKRLDTFWINAPLNKKWEIRVFDAVVTTKLLYGLEPASLSKLIRIALTHFKTKDLEQFSASNMPTCLLVKSHKRHSYQ